VMFSVCAVSIVILNEYAASAYEIPPTTGESGHSDLIPLLDVGAIVVISGVAILALVIVYFLVKNQPLSDDFNQVLMVHLEVPKFHSFRLGYRAQKTLTLFQHFSFRHDIHSIPIFMMSNTMAVST
jgi:hypothetical protein